MQRRHAAYRETALATGQSVEAVEDLIGRVDPALMAALRVLTASAAAPALPYVTAAGRAQDEIERLRLALMQAVADPDLAEARAALLISGFLAPERHSFRRTVAMAERALREPCAKLG